MNGTTTDANSEPPPVVEVEFVLESSSYPFVYATKEEDCRFDLAQMLPREGGQIAEVFNVRGAEPTQILDLVSEYGSLEPQVLRRSDAGTLVEFLVSSGCPVYLLVKLGALPRTVTGVDGEGTITAEIPRTYQPSSVIDEFLSTYADAELVAKRKQDAATTMFALSRFENVLQTQLTERQREVLETAFEAGYYDWPRTATGKEVAAELDITSATFSEHINNAERKLFTAMFRDGRAF